MSHPGTPLGRDLDVVGLIVSTGRTGTRALAAYFDAAYPEVRAVHEPRPTWRLRVASCRTLAGEVGRPERLRLLRACRRGRLEAVAEPVYLESNPSLFGFLDVLDEAFGRPRVVHVVRDPRTYVRSVINFGSYRGLKGVAVRLLRHWIPKPEYVEREAGRRWAGMSRIERTAWLWATINAALDRGADLFGDRYVRMRFEELFSAEGPGLGRLAEWIGLPQRPELAARARAGPINTGPGRPLPPWPEWDAGALEAVYRHCAELMERYGYER